jgi:hypothetical protein
MHPDPEGAIDQPRLQRFTRQRPTWHCTLDTPGRAVQSVPVTGRSSSKKGNMHPPPANVFINVLTEIKMKRPTGVQGAPDIDAFPFGFVSASGGTRTAQDMASWAAFFGKDKHAGARSQSTHVTFYPDLRNRRRAGLSLAATVAFNLGSWADTLAVLRLGIAVLTLLETL